MKAFNVHFTINGQKMCERIEAENPRRAETVVRTRHKGYSIIVEKIKKTS